MSLNMMFCSYTLFLSCLFTSTYFYLSSNVIGTHLLSFLFVVSEFPFEYFIAKWKELMQFLTLSCLSHLSHFTFQQDFL